MLTAARLSTDDVARDDLSLVAWLAVVGGWIAFLAIRERWGREARASGRPAGDGAAGSLELPDDPPVLADALRHGGATSPSALGVIVLDLARRGYLDVVEEAGRWRFRRRETPRGDLRPYENAVYTRLFAAGNETTFDDLLAWAQSHRQQSKVFLERIRKYVENDLTERGYVERPSRLPVVLNLAAAAFVLLAGLLALVNGAVVGLVAVVSALGQAALGRALRRRTLQGADRAEEWYRAAQTLRKVDAMVDDMDGAVPAGEAAAWDRYLVYAAALGVFAEFTAGLARRDAALVLDGELASWLTSDAPGVGRVAGVGRFVGAFGPRLVEVVERAPEVPLPAGAATAAAPGAAAGAPAGPAPEPAPVGAGVPTPPRLPGTPGAPPAWPPVAPPPPPSAPSSTSPPPVEPDSPASEGPADPG